MPRGAEISMLDMSILRPSIAPEPEHMQNAPSDRTKCEAPRKLTDFNKLRGKAKTSAVAQLKETIASLPDFKEEHAQACEVLKERRNAVRRILKVLGEDAAHLPMDVLGDFRVVATNPVPFADALEEAKKQCAQESPERTNNKMLPAQEKKMKTSASLTRVSSFSKTSSVSNKSVKAGNSTLRSTRDTSKNRTAATPLKQRKPGKK